MFDHVTIRVSDLDASRRFYGLALSTLGFGMRVGESFTEWNDFSISEATDDTPLTRNLHVAFVSSSHEEVDEWWRVMTRAGYDDDGPPGPRPVYAPTTTAASSSIPTGTASKPCITTRRAQAMN